jgi:hypothetical protein
MKNKLHHTATAMTPWVAAAVQFMTLDDHLYFENSATDESSKL